MSPWLCLAPVWVAKSGSPVGFLRGEAKARQAFKVVQGLGRLCLGTGRASLRVPEPPAQPCISHLPAMRVMPPEHQCCSRPGRRLSHQQLERQQGPAQPGTCPGDTGQ